jgi:branched-chain amino acid aminotransferase
LHYGQAVFDGLKAFRAPTDEIRLFRPQRHLRRLNASAARLCIPLLDEVFTLQALTELVRLDADWVPGTPGCSLYIRPTLMATDPTLSVHPSRTYRFFDPVAGWGLLSRGLRAGQDPGRGPLRPRGQGRPRGGEGAGQLCRELAGGGRGPHPGLYASALAGWPRAPLH